MCFVYLRRIFTWRRDLYIIPTPLSDSAVSPNESDVSSRLSSTLTSTMNPPGALPIVGAVEKILNHYNQYNPDPAEFTLTTNSASLKTVDVLLALLRHAIAPSSVASEVWNSLRVYFNDIIEQRGDPTNPRSLTLRPRDGEWTTVDAGLLKMSETAFNELTEEMSTCARDWMTRLLLPSMLPSRCL